MNRPRAPRLLGAMLAALMLVFSACGGSAGPEPLSPEVSSDTISEADALATAEAAATDAGFSIEGLEVQPGLLFGEWQVSYEPVNTGSLTGGFLVVLDARTGELLDIVAYQ